MAYSQIDPARLEGDALTQWYLRSTDDIQQERQEAAAQRYRDFFGAGDRVSPDSQLDAGPASPTRYADPSHKEGATAEDNIKPGFNWMSVGPNRWRRISVTSNDALSNLGTGDSISSDVGTFDRKDGDARGSGASRPAVGNEFRPGPSVAPFSTPTSPVNAHRANPGAVDPPYRRLPAPPPPALSPSHLHGPTQSPFGSAADAFHDWQHGRKMQRPNLAESFIPVVGPAWEAVADLQDGNYGGAAFNGVMAVADALPFGAAIKGFNAARKGIGILKEGSVTADAARKVLRRVGMAKPGQEIHHTFPLDGLGRNVQDWRNHYALLKPLPQEIHRRLTGRWMGKPEFDPVRKIWYGTTDWQKAVPTAIAGYAADAWENLTHPFNSPAGGATSTNRKP